MKSTKTEGKAKISRCQRKMLSEHSTAFGLGLVESCRGFPFGIISRLLPGYTNTHTLINAWNLFTVVVLVVVALFSFNTPPYTVLCSLGTSCESRSLKAFRRFVLTQLSSAIQTGRLCRFSFSFSRSHRTTSRRVFRFRFRLLHCYRFGFFL